LNLIFTRCEPTFDRPFHGAAGDDVTVELKE